jgi:hypothetical protein
MEWLKKRYNAFSKNVRPPVSCSKKYLFTFGGLETIFDVFSYTARLTGTWSEKAIF